MVDLVNIGITDLEATSEELFLHRLNSQARQSMNAAGCSQMHLHCAKIMISAQHCCHNKSKGLVCANYTCKKKGENGNPRLCPREHGWTNAGRAIVSTQSHRLPHPFQEKDQWSSGSSQQLHRLIATLEKGDTLIVTRLDRLARVNS